MAETAEPLPPGYIQSVGENVPAAAPVNPWAGVASFTQNTAAPSPDMFSDLIPKDGPVPVQGHGEVAAQALLRGAMEGGKEVGQATSPFKDRPAGVPQRDYVGKLLEPGSLAKNVTNPDWYIANFLHGASSMAPSLALGAAGAVGGTAAGELMFPGVGGVVGGPVGAGAGFGAGSMMQGIAASFQRARADGLDPQAAADRAYNEAYVNGAFGFAQGVAPEVKVLGKVGTVVGDKVYQMAKKPVTEALFQIFGIQPGLGLAQQADIKHLEGQQLTPQEAEEGYVKNAGMGLGLVGVHQAISGLRGTNKLPPVAWGNTPDGQPPPGPPGLPRGQPIDAEFTEEPAQTPPLIATRPGPIPPRLPTRDSLAAAIQNPPGEPPPGGTAEPATATAPAAPAEPNPAPALPALPTRDSLAAALEGKTAAPPPPAAVPPLLLPPPTTFAPPQGPPPGLPVLSLKDRIPLMPYTELMNMYGGSDVRNRNLAKAELDRRFPDGSATKVHDVAAQAGQVDTGATDAQKEAGNYQMGHVVISGIPITIEHPAGSIRTGTGPNGPWETHMPVHYGRIKGTEGADGENVDIFLGDNHNSDKVYVVDQKNPDTEKWDEHKALMGFSDEKEAKSAYIRSFSDGKGSARIGAITEMTTTAFKGWLKAGDQSRPLAYVPPVEQSTPHPDMFADLIPPPAAPPAEPPMLAENTTKEPEKTPEKASTPEVPPASGPETHQGYKVGDVVHSRTFGEMTIESIDAGGLRGKLKNPINMMGNLVEDASVGFDDLISREDWKPAPPAAAPEAPPPAAAEPEGPKVGDTVHWSGLPFTVKEVWNSVRDKEPGVDLVPQTTIMNDGVKVEEMSFKVSELDKGPPEKAPPEVTTWEKPDWRPQSEKDAPPEPPAPKVKKISKVEQAKNYAEALKLYFEPGRVVENYAGDHDRVISYHPEAGHFSVTVEAVKQHAGEWVTDGQQRNHSTPPERGEMKAFLASIGRLDLLAKEKAPAPAEPAKPREKAGPKLQDTGTLETFKEEMKNAPMPEQAKKIIEATRQKVVFNIEKREDQTTGVARFAQKILEGTHSFSDYLKDKYILQKSSRGRYGGKQKGWEDQVKDIFADDADKGYGSERIPVKRKDIIEAAEQYIDFGKQLSDLFARSKNVQEFKIELQKASGYNEHGTNDITSEFGKLIGKFESNYNLLNDIFSTYKYGEFANITDESEVKVQKRVQNSLIRPKLDMIERLDRPDYRKGKDVTPQEVKDKFRFKEVVFGEWARGKEGQAHINHCYDALLDLADRLKIKPTDISLGGELTLAIGLEGSGEHAAHFNPATNLINLTKTKGDGAVAHEWFHALDHALTKKMPGNELMRQMERALKQRLYAQNLEDHIKEFLKGGRSYYRGGKKMNYGGVIGHAKEFISRLGRTGGVWSQFAHTTDYKKNSDEIGKDYWGLDRELFARAGESFIHDTLEGKSPYLVNDWVGEGVVTKENGYKGTAFPIGEERKAFNELFNDFFGLVEFSDSGVSVKPGGQLSVDKDVAKIKEEAESFLPKLGAMLREIENGRVQQTGVQPRIPDSHEPEGPENVSGTDGGEGSGSGGEGGDGGRLGPVSDTGGEHDNEKGSDTGSSGQGGSGSGVQGDDTVPAGDGGAEGRRPVYESVAANHKIAVGALDEARGQKQKARDNLKIIAKVKEIELANRPATPEEQVLLAKFTGWGGIKNAFPNNVGKPHEGWEDIHDAVKNELTKAEYDEANRTIQYAHYTSEIIVRGMWKAMQKFGYERGTVFEPGMGIGNFIGMMPDSLKMQYAGLEYDAMSARIAKILYPMSSVVHDSFIDARYSNDMYDAAIGNPPFQAKGTGYKYNKVPVSLHNFFFLKSIDMVAPGGVIAFVTSTGTLDNRDSSARKMMAENVDLVGAIRLPNTAFKTNAHTDVVTDIIFLRKRLPGEISNGVLWQHTLPIDLMDEDGHFFQVNEYFKNNPQMVLGDYSNKGTMYGPNSLTVEPVKNHDLPTQLDAAIASLPSDIAVNIQKANTDAFDHQPATKKEGSYYIKEGKIYQVEKKIGVPVEGLLKSKGGLSKSEAVIVRGLIPIRDAWREARNAMVDRDDEAMKAAQKELHKVYDSFVEKHGYLTKNEIKTRAPTATQIENARDKLRSEMEAQGLDFDEGDIDLSHMIAEINTATGKNYTPSEIATERVLQRTVLETIGRTVDEGSFDPEDVEPNVKVIYPNIDPMKMDQESYNLLALEEFNEETGETKKTDFFYKNVVGEMKKPEMKTAVDAMNYALVMKNGVDVDFMAQELGKNPEAIVQELMELDLIYALPDHEKGGNNYVSAEEYLSGYVKDKLAYAKQIAEKDKSYQRNVMALDGVQPADIPHERISTQFGASYFDPEVIEDFMMDALNIHVSVKKIPIINGWEITSHDRYSPENTTQYGTEKRNAHVLVEHLLSQKPIIVTVTDSEGKTHVDMEGSQAAQEKAKLIQEKFNKWIWQSKQGERVYKNFQETMNNYVKRVYNGKHLTTAISPKFSLFAHQKNAAWRVLQSGNTYLAHAVGSGKTLEMIVTVMEHRRLGLWKKPLIVVPNHMLGQFAQEFKEAYPQANIIVADEDHFHSDRRKKFVATIAATDLDCVIMTEASYGLVPVSKEFEARMIEGELAKYRMALEGANADKRKSEKPKRGSPAARIQGLIEKLETRLKSLRANVKEQNFNFEQLGVDAILVDEAHTFRKLNFVTLQGRVNGLNPTGSQKAWDMFMKSRVIDDKTPGRGLVFASGTPITNTLAEVFTLQRFFQERSMKAKNLDNFDAWSGTFAKSITEPERQVSGKYKNVTRLADFKNMAVLSPMTAEFMDWVTSEQLNSLVDRPTLKSGEMILKVVKPTREYLAYQKYLADRVEELSRNPNRGKKGEDNILSVITDGRLAAIDMRLIDPTLPHQESKLEAMISHVYDSWKTSSDREYKMKARRDDRISPIKGATQLIFSDLGVNGKSKNGKTFSCYGHIKSQLLKYGVPAKEIAFAGDYNTTVEKRTLYRKVNNGEVRVLIGSTAKMGTGVNVQNRLLNLHNLDCKYNPSDLEQRNGRALRQGNQNPEIGIFAYSTDGSMDTQMWQMMAQKTKRIENFGTGKDTQDQSDIVQMNAFDEARVMTAGDAREIRKMELQHDVNKLQGSANNFAGEQRNIQVKIGSLKSGIAYHENSIKETDSALKERKEPPKDEFLMTVMGVPYTVRAEACGALDAAVQKIAKGGSETSGDGIKIGELQGFDVKMFAGVEKQEKWDKQANELVGNATPMSYEVFLNHPALVKGGKGWSNSGPEFSATGTITILTNSLNKLAGNKAQSEEQIKANERDIKKFESQIKDKFADQAILDEKKAELAAITKDLHENAPVDVEYHDYPVDYWKANKLLTGKSGGMNITNDDPEFSIPDQKPKGNINDVMKNQALRKSSGK